MRTGSPRPTTCSTGWSTSASRGPSWACPATWATRRRSASGCRRAAWSSSARSCPSTSAGPRRPTRTGRGCATTCASCGRARRKARSRTRSCRTSSTSPTGGRSPAGSPSTPRRGCRPARFATLIDNLHRAAELCRSEGLEPVIHPHAGTYIETADEIARVMDADRPVDHRPVPRHRPFPVRRGRPGPGGRRLPRARPPRPHQGLQDLGHGEVKREGKGLDEALRRGVFCPLGEGDVDIGAVIDRAPGHDYTGWLVIEQDQALGRPTRPNRSSPASAPTASTCAASGSDAGPPADRLACRPRQPVAAGWASRSRYSRRNEAVASTSRSTSSSVWAPVRKPRIM